MVSGAAVEPLLAHEHGGQGGEVQDQQRRYHGEPVELLGSLMVAERCQREEECKKLEENPKSEPGDARQVVRVADQDRFEKEFEPGAALGAPLHDEVAQVVAAPWAWNIAGGQVLA